MAKKQKQKISKKKKTGISIIGIIVLIICGVIMAKKLDVDKELKEANHKLEQLDEEYAKELEKEKDIEKEKEYRETEQYIEDTAHDSMGLVYPDEILIVPQE